MLYFTSFYNSKIFIPNRLANLFEKIILIKEKSCFLEKKYIFKALIGLLSSRFYYKNSLKSNKLFNKLMNKILIIIPIISSKTFTNNIAHYIKKYL